MDKQTILIVDDEEGIRESLNLILKDRYILKFATDGQECLKALEQDKNIPVVLIDIKMPKVNGIEITRRIKELYPKTKVIIVTGYASAEIAQEATQAGADDYIVKPFETKDILKKISNFV